MALYASLHFVVYEDEEARPSWPTTPLSPCSPSISAEGVTQVAQVVEQKLEALLAAVVYAMEHLTLTSLKS